MNLPSAINALTVSIPWRSLDFPAISSVLYLSLCTAHYLMYVFYSQDNILHERSMKFVYNVFGYMYTIHR